MSIAFRIRPRGAYSRAEGLVSATGHALLSHITKQSELSRACHNGQFCGNVRQTRLGSAVVAHAELSSSLLPTDPPPSSSNSIKSKSYLVSICVEQLKLIFLARHTHRGRDRCCSRSDHTTCGVDAYISPTKLEGVLLV